MNADGSNDSELAIGLSHSWSPDGQKIAFTSERDGNWEIYVMNADGSNQTRMSDDTHIDRYPKWLTCPQRLVHLLS